MRKSQSKKREIWIQVLVILLLLYSVLTFTTSLNRRTETQIVTFLLELLRITFRNCLLLICSRRYLPYDPEKLYLKVTQIQNEFMKTSIFQKSNENIVRISALNFFVDSCGFSGSFLGLPRDVVSNIIYKKASRKPQGRYRNFQRINPYIIFVGILENWCPHKFILSLIDLLEGEPKWSTSSWWFLRGADFIFIF